MAAVTIEQVNEAIANLVSSPQVDYTIGNKTVKAGQKMDQLIKLREALMSNPEADISIASFDLLDIDEFGTLNI